MKKFVRVKGHNNWFLSLSKNEELESDFSDNMKEKMLRTHVKTIHNKNKSLDFSQRLIMLGLTELNYLDLAKKHGTILIRPSGTYMPLRGSDVIEEKISDTFPIDDYGDIVICENDKSSESTWVNYLRKRFPKKSIVTINFFDLRTDGEIKDYFEKAEYVTFSTTFTNTEWFEKLKRNLSDNNKVIGLSHDNQMWDSVDTNNIEIEEIYNID